MSTADPDTTRIHTRVRVLRTAGGIALAATLLLGCGEDDSPGTGGEGVTESDEGGESPGTSVAGNEGDGESDGLNSEPDSDDGDQPADSGGGDTGG